MLKLGRHGQAVVFGCIALGLAVATSIAGGRFVDPYGWIPLTAAAAVILLAGGLRSRAAWSGFGIASAGLGRTAPGFLVGTRSRCNEKDSLQSQHGIN